MVIHRYKFSVAHDAKGKGRRHKNDDVTVYEPHSQRRSKHVPTTTESAGPAHALHGLHRLANLVDVNLGAPGNVLQRYPVKSEGELYKDSVFTDVVMERIGDHVFRIQSNSKLVFYEADTHSYYELKGEDEPDYEKPYALGGVSAVAVAPPTLYGDIGAQGKGVGFVTQDTTLSTSGLLTCVGWLLYNDNAAYLTHIVVEQPEHVLENGGIQEQANALAELFEQKVGSKPTKVHIQVDGEQQAYENEHIWRAGWMLELVPQGCMATWQRGAADFSYSVSAKAGTRVEWSGPAIQVYTGEEDDRGDIHTAPNRVIPAGGVFELEL